MNEFSFVLTHSLAAETCLANLLMGSKTRKDKDGFFGYSVSFWIHHWTHAAEKGRQGRLGKLFAEFLAVGKAKSPILHWVTVQSHKNSWARWQSSQPNGLYLVRSIPPNPLFAACAFGFYELVTQYFTASDGSWVSNLNGDTALEIAISMEQFEVVKLLLDMGLRELETLEGPRRDSALNFAVRRSNVAMVMFLLDHGIKIWETAETETVLSYNPVLIEAITRGDTEMVRLLIRRGANVNVRNAKTTALIAAVKGGHEGVVQTLLLEDGLDLEATDEHGMTALIVAAVAGARRIVTLLLENGARVHGVVDGHDSDLPFLHFLACVRRSEDVRSRLKDGNDVNRRDGYGRTALHIAAVDSPSTPRWKRQLRRVTLALLEHGADMGATDNQGKTPLHYAAARRLHWALGIIAQMFARGGNFQLKDNSGKTPLDYVPDDLRWEEIEYVDEMLRKDGKYAQAQVLLDMMREWKSTRPDESESGSDTSRDTITD
jgi:ankyrin repeat protein